MGQLASVGWVLLLPGAILPTSSGSASPSLAAPQPLPSGTFRHHGSHAQFNLVTSQPNNLKASLDPNPLQLLLPLLSFSAQARKGQPRLAVPASSPPPLPNPRNSASLANCPCKGHTLLNPKDGCLFLSALLPAF